MTDIAKISVAVSMSGTICPRNVSVKFRHYYVMNGTMALIVVFIMSCSLPWKEDRCRKVKTPLVIKLCRLMFALSPPNFSIFDIK